MIVREFLESVVVASSSFGAVLNFFVGMGVGSSFMAGEWGVIPSEVVVFMKYLNFMWTRRMDDVIVHIKALRYIGSVTVAHTGCLILYRGAESDNVVLSQRVKFMVLEVSSNSLDIHRDDILFIGHLKIEAREYINEYEGLGLME